MLQEKGLQLVTSSSLAEPIERNKGCQAALRSIASVAGGYACYRQNVATHRIASAHNHIFAITNCA